MNKEQLSGQLKNVSKLLNEKQETLDYIEKQQTALNDKFAALNIEKLQLTDSFQKLLGELKEIEQEVQILEQKILQQN